MAIIQLIGQPLISLVASGGLSLMPLNGLQRPSNFDFTYTDTSIDIQIDFTWDPPTGGPVPDGYRLLFVNDLLGTVEINVSSLDNLAAQIQGVPYAASWGAGVYSKLLTEESASADLSGITPDAPYP